MALERVGAQAEQEDFAGAFPILDEAQIGRLRRYGVEESVPAGFIFFREGERGTDFIVVLSGSVEAVAHFGESGETTSTVFNPGQFVGVMNILSNEGAYVTATRECFLGVKEDGSPSPLAGCRMPLFMHDEPFSELIAKTAHLSGPRIAEIMIASLIPTRIIL